MISHMYPFTQLQKEVPKRQIIIDSSILSVNFRPKLDTSFCNPVYKIFITWETVSFVSFIITFLLLRAESGNVIQASITYDTVVPNIILCTRTYGKCNIIYKLLEIIVRQTLHILLTKKVLLPNNLFAISNKTNLNFKYFCLEINCEKMDRHLNRANKKKKKNRIKRFCIRALSS